MNKKFSLFGSICYIFICILFEVSFLTTVRINDSYTIASSIESYLLFSPINVDQQTYYDIFNKDMMLQFIHGNLFQIIYNETKKEYPSQVNGYHYLQYFNYLMGIRITYNRAELKSTSDSKTGTDYVRVGNYEETPIKDYSNVDTTTWGSTKIPYSSSGGYNNLGGYIFHVPNDYNIDEVINLENQLIADGFIDDQFLSAVFEVVFYNENYQTGVILVYEFLQNNAGELKIANYQKSFFESRYSKNYHQISGLTQIVLIILEVIFCFGLLWLIYEACKLIYMNIIVTFVKIRTLAMNSFDYIDIAIVVFMIISFGYRYYLVFVQSKIILKTDRISLDNLSSFISDAEITESFTITSSITTVFISICFLRILTMQFPSFGALFETVAVSIKDILNIFTSLTIILIGFVVSACILFGDSIKEFRNIQNALNKLFYYLFGIGDINEYSIFQQTLFRLFYVSFSLIFYFILMKVLISIVIIRYRYLRSLKQLRNEAIARKVARQSKVLKEHFKNLILFRRPHASYVNNKSENKEEGDMLSKRWMIFKQNIMNIYNINKIQSLDEREEEIKEIEEEIKKEKEEYKNKMIYTFSEKNVSFDNIFETSLITDWFVNYIQVFQSSDYIFQNQNYFIGDPFCRVLLRKLKNHTNTNDDTKEIFKTYIANKNYKISDNLGNEADTSIIYLAGNVKLDYIPYGNSTSPNKADGYLSYLNRNISVYQAQGALLDKNIYSANWIHQVFQMFLFNRNSGFFSRHEIAFKKLASGELLHTYNVLSTSLKYETNFDYFRGFLEVVIVVVTSWYVYRILKSLLFILIEIETDQLQSQPEELKKNSMVFRFLWFDKIKYMEKSNSIGLLTFFIRVIASFFRLIYNFVRAIYRYCASSIFNILNMVSITIIIVCISIWIQIATTDIFELNEQGQSSDAFDTIDNVINLLSDYESLICFNILLMFLNIMQYFSFSSKLSIFYEVLRNSLFDIIFFGLMQTIIMCGYALIGFMLFGVSDEEFSSFSDSFFTMFLIFINGKSILEITTPNVVTLYLFGVSFNIISLMLLNMLVAIYASHYFQFYCDHDFVNINMFFFFLKLIGGKKPKDIEKLNFIIRWFYKFRNLFNILAVIFENFVNESKEKEEEFHTYDHLKHLNNNHFSYASKDIKDLVMKSIYGNTKRNIFCDNMRIKKEYSKVYFWTSTLNDHLTRKIKTSFKSYCSAFNLVSDCKQFEEDKMDKDSDVFNDNEIKFLMSPNHKKIEMWNKADFLTSRRYWKVIDCNKDLYKESSESLYSEVEYNNKNLSSNYKEEQKIKSDDSSEFFKSKTFRTNKTFREIPSVESDSKFDNESNSEEILDLYCVDIQKEIWIQTEDYSKLFYLWTECFTIKQMNCLWNSLEFPFEYFKMLKKNKLITDSFKEEIERIERCEVVYNYRELVKLMKNKELNLLLETILSDIYQEENDENIKQDNECFFKIMIKCREFNDLKTPLWLILPLKTKMIMCISQNDNFELKIMTLLILKEMRIGIKKLRMIDKELEGTVSNLIFDMYFCISQEKAVNIRHQLIENRANQQEIESKEMINYIDFMTENFNKINKNKQNYINKVKMEFINSPIYKKKRNISNI